MFFVLRALVLSVCIFPAIALQDELAQLQFIGMIAIGVVVALCAHKLFGIDADSVERRNS